MSPARRQAILAATMLLLLGLVAWWNVEWMLQQRQSARAGAQDLAECRRLAQEIKALRLKPAVAASQALGIQELGQRIQQAFEQAQLPPASLEGVYPQSLRRVGDSPYLHKPTALALRNASLAQFATFLHALTDNSGMSVRDLRLREPRSDATGKVWDAEATLVYLIYSPTSTNRAAQ
jgi:hypothetical protein